MVGVSDRLVIITLICDRPLVALLPYTDATRSRQILACRMSHEGNKKSLFETYPPQHT